MRGEKSEGAKERPAGASGLRGARHCADQSHRSPGARVRGLWRGR